MWTDCDIFQIANAFGLWHVSAVETSSILSIAICVIVAVEKMYVDIRSQIAQRQRKVDTVEMLWKTKLVAKRPGLIALVAYYKVTNAVLKEALKVKVRLTALLWERERK